MPVSLTRWLWERHDGYERGQARQASSKAWQGGHSPTSHFTRRYGSAPDAIRPCLSSPPLRPSIPRSRQHANHTTS